MTSMEEARLEAYITRLQDENREAKKACEEARIALTQAMAFMPVTRLKALIHENPAALKAARIALLRSHRQDKAERP